MIYAVGIGPGDPDLLPQKTVSLLQRADVITGFNTVLNIPKCYFSSKAQVFPLTYKNQKEKLEQVGKLSRKGKTCVACFMGDLNFSGYEFLDQIHEHCQEPNPILIPGISSAQIAAVRTETAFESAIFLTFHKRGDIEPDKNFLIESLTRGKDAIVIPKPWDFMPGEICSFLMENGIPGATPVHVFENLTLESEKVFKATIQDCAEQFSDMSIMVIKPSGLI
ncbi:hypothetical protein UZ36_01070 [Candidatus Nitromaritima sp. SCGC AAA799-C22]|nr:hypothetical protein UZ36_01070 [Candidatus Nitromaritima sp. SCGC AAA799-C22]